MKVSKKIIDIRNDNGLTQEEFADILCVSRQTISNWENEKCYPDIETLIIISNKFNISLDELLKEDEDMIKDISKKIKSNKEKKVIIIILSLILVLVIWFSYKIFLLCYYDNNYNKSILSNYIENLEKISVKTDKSLANYEFADMNIYMPRILKEHVHGLSIGTSKHRNLFPTLINKQVYFKGINYKNVFENYNIDNPIDIIKCFKDKYNNKSNIFWNRNQLKLKFLVEYFIANEINMGGMDSKHYYFENDIEGHILEDTNNYTIYIYHNNETYEINISKIYYDFDVVMKVLESIYFE